MSCAVRYYSEPKVLFPVSRGSFLPSPDVDSAVIRLDIRREPPSTRGTKKPSSGCARRLFDAAQDAAQLPFGGLPLPKERAAALLERAGVPAGARAEQLTLEQFAAVSRALAEEA